MSHLPSTVRHRFAVTVANPQTSWASASATTAPGRPPRLRSCYSTLHGGAGLRRPSANQTDPGHWTAKATEVNPFYRNAAQRSLCTRRINELTLLIKQRQREIEELRDGVPQSWIDNYGSEKAAQWTRDRIVCARCDIILLEQSIARLTIRRTTLMAEAGALEGKAPHDGSSSAKRRGRPRKASSQPEPVGVRAHEERDDRPPR